MRPQGAEAQPALLPTPTPHPRVALRPRPSQNTSLSPHLPAWVLSLPIQKLWVASNQLSQLLPAKAGRVRAGLGRGVMGPGGGRGVQQKTLLPMAPTYLCAFVSEARA